MIIGFSASLYLIKVPANNIIHNFTNLFLIIMDIKNNLQLQLAYDFVQFTGKNIFLTGKAGTGKTTFLHNLKKHSPKRIAVV